MICCFFFFFKQKTAYEIGVRLVGSEMCIRDRWERVWAGPRDHESTQSAPPPDDGGELPPRGVQTTAAPQTTLVLPSCARPPLPRSALGAEGLRKKHGQQYHPTYPLPS